MNSRKNKEFPFPVQERKQKQSFIHKKPIQRVLKDYVSCFHQKNMIKKDFFIGSMDYTVSINIKDYSKTLQAYNSLDSLLKFAKPGATNKEKNSENIDSGYSKITKIKCEGYCGKNYNRTYLKNFSEDGKIKALCPDCVEKVSCRSS